MAQVGRRSYAARQPAAGHKTNDLDPTWSTGIGQKTVLKSTSIHPQINIRGQSNQPGHKPASSHVVFDKNPQILALIWP